MTFKIEKCRNVHFPICLFFSRSRSLSLSFFYHHYTSLTAIWCNFVFFSLISSSVIYISYGCCCLFVFCSCFVVVVFLYILQTILFFLRVAWHLHDLSVCHILFVHGTVRYWVHTVHILSHSSLRSLSSSLTLLHSLCSFSLAHTHTLHCCALN